MIRLLLRSFAAALLLSSLQAVAQKAPLPDPGPAGWQHTELRRFPAAEAKQGVAVDAEFFYAISNQALGKYRKSDGARVGGWKQEKGGPLIHMNSGIVREGRLYCAHSNFPNIPMTSSIEIWETATMKHVDSHSLGIDAGSLTWLDFRGSERLACFAHYSKDRPRTGRDPSWTEVVRFDAEWRRTGGWIFPEGVVEKFGGASSSGGAFGPGGFLFITGHDAPALYVLALPEAGSAFRWVATIPISAEGQAFAWDPDGSGTLYSISRRTSEVIVSRVENKDGATEKSRP